MRKSAPAKEALMALFFFFLDTLRRLQLFTRRWRLLTSSPTVASSPYRDALEAQKLYFQAKCEEERERRLELEQELRARRSGELYTAGMNTLHWFLGVLAGMTIMAFSLINGLPLPRATNHVMAVDPVEVWGAHVFAQPDLSRSAHTEDIVGNTMNHRGREPFKFFLLSGASGSCPGRFSLQLDDSKYRPVLLLTIDLENPWNDTPWRQREPVKMPEPVLLFSPNAFSLGLE